MMSSEIDETSSETIRIGNKNMWIKTMRFQHWGLINYVHAKSLLIQGSTFFKLHFFGGRRKLINNGMLSNPDLTLQETSSAELLGGEGADFLRWVAFWSIRSSGLLR